MFFSSFFALFGLIQSVLQVLFVSEGYYSRGQSVLYPVYYYSGLVFVNVFFYFVNLKTTVGLPDEFVFLIELK